MWKAPWQVTWHCGGLTALEQYHSWLHEYHRAGFRKHFIKTCVVRGARVTSGWICRKPTRNLLDEKHLWKPGAFDLARKRWSKGPQMAAWIRKSTLRTYRLSLSFPVCSLCYIYEWWQLGGKCWDQDSRLRKRLTTHLWEKGKAKRNRERHFGCTCVSAWSATTASTGQMVISGRDEEEEEFVCLRDWHSIVTKGLFNKCLNGRIVHYHPSVTTRWRAI